MSAVVLLLAAVVVTEASRRLEVQSTERALRLNPFNTEARLRLLTDGLISADMNSLAALKKEAQRGVWLAPGDARLRSAMGEIVLREGDAEAAAALFSQAHKLAQTERYALHALISRAIEDRNDREILRLIDVSLRRWPGSYSQFELILLTLAADPTSYDAVAALLNTNPPWRTRFLVSLARMEGGEAQTFAILQDLMDGPTPPSRPEIASVVQLLATRGQYREAYRLFLFSLSEEEWLRAGLIHNGLFAATSGIPPFDWTYASNAYAEVSLGNQSRLASGATVRFFNRPTRRVNLQQTLVLEPGAYRLRLETSARSLIAPRGLYWTLRCVTPTVELARLDLKQGTYLDNELVVEFIVDNCPAQILELHSGLTIDSLRFAYSGSVTFHNISIERL